MTAPTAAQIQSDAAKLISMAVWLGVLDNVASNADPAALRLTLQSTNLNNDWKQSAAPLDAMATIANAQRALAKVVPTFYGGSAQTSKLRDMAAALRDLAGRMGTFSVTANDVAWIQSVRTFMTGIDDDLGSGALGITSVTPALVALLDPTLPTNMIAIAIANGDTEGAAALQQAENTLLALSATIFPGGASIPALSAADISNTILPDLQGIVASKIVTTVPPVGGGSGTTKAGSSTTMIVGTVLAVGALGTLAYLLATQGAPAAPQLARRNPAGRKREWYSRPTLTPRNREGMTLLEWTRAANAFGTVFSASSRGRERARKAWLEGEDPTEYAAHGRLIA